MPTLRQHQKKLFERVKPGDRVRLAMTIADSAEFELTVERVTWCSLFATEAIFVDSSAANPRGETEFSIVEGHRIVSVNGEPY